jgi:DNA-binding MarR family transcriptional regulator
MTSTTGRPQGQPSALACDGNQALTLNRLIRDARGLTTSEKAFLWCIVSHTNAETGVAYPGLRLLQEELGMSRPGLLKVIDRLTQLGCLGVAMVASASWLMR